MKRSAALNASTACGAGGRVTAPDDARLSGPEGRLVSF
jgi:hypothetical protein